MARNLNRGLNQANVDKAREHWQSRTERRDPQAWFVNDPTVQGGVRVAEKKGEKAAFPVKFQREKP